MRKEFNETVKDYQKMGFNLDDATELANREQEIANDVDQLFKKYIKEKASGKKEHYIGVKIFVPEAFFNDIKRAARIKRMTLTEIVESLC